MRPGAFVGQHGPFYTPWVWNISPIRCFGSILAYRSRKAAPMRTRGGGWKGFAGNLLRDLVPPFAGRVLRRFNRLSTLAAEDADEAANRVRLPAGRCHDLRQRSALGPFHHRDDLGLLVSAVAA